MFVRKRGYTIPLILGFLTLLGMIFVAETFAGGLFGPEKTIYMRFKDPGPLPERMDVYYKGIKVGKVTGMKFSEDYKYTVLTVEIRKKDFNPPNNIYAEIKIEGEARFWAQGINITQYIDLAYPENPSSTSLKDKDTIEGRIGDIERIQEYLKESLSKEEVESSVDNIQQITKNTEEATQNLAQVTEKINIFLDRNQQKMNEIVSRTNEAIANLNATAENTRSITLTMREFAEKPGEETGLRSALQNLAEFTENINTVSIDLGKFTGDVGFRDELIATPGEIRKFISGTNRNVEEFIQSTNATIARLDQKVCITLNDADRAINRYDCIGAGISDLMSERFLVFKLLFGKPGEAFELCTGPCPPNFEPFNCSPGGCPLRLRSYQPPVYQLRPSMPCPVVPGQQTY